MRQFYDVCGNLFRVAITSKNEVSGYTIGCPKVHSCDAWILVLAVMSHHRLKGIGKELTSSLIQEFKKLDMRRVLLTVSPENKSAISLYHGIGFNLIAQEPNYFGEGSPRNIMQKFL